jgi:hypothetical protein
VPALHVHTPCRENLDVEVEVLGLLHLLEGQGDKEDDALDHVQPPRDVVEKLFPLRPMDAPVEIDLQVAVAAVDRPGHVSNEHRTCSNANHGSASTDNLLRAGGPGERP